MRERYRELDRRRKLAPEEVKSEVEKRLADARQPATVELDLASYALVHLPPLDSLHHLEHLDISENSIADISRLSELHSLKSLDCSSCPISDVQPLAGLKNLLRLQADNIPTKDLCPLSSLAQLQVLAIRSSATDDFSFLAHLTQLEQFYPAGSDVRDWAPASYLINLDALNCSGCSLRSLLFVENLTKLSWLSCSFNDLEDLEPLGGLGKLRNLRAGYTGIRSLDPLRSCGTLEHLEVRNTKVETLSPLSELTELRKLVVSGTEILSLAGLEGLRNLEDLDFSYTRVSNLSVLQSIPSITTINANLTDALSVDSLSDALRLRKLMISNTSVDDLTPIQRLRELEEIDCSGTKVRDLSPLALLPALKELSCRHIRSGDWPPELLNSPTLQRVSAFGARIGSIPPEDLAEPNCLPALRAYFEDIAAGAEPLERVKIIVLGNGRVGKTQLRRWLLNERPEQPCFDPGVPSTHGIEVLRSKIVVPTPTGKGVQSLDVSFWDFGGQDIYHGTHGLFMRTRAIFLLCWCPEQEDSKQQELGGLMFENQPLGYWLDYVRQLAGVENPVIVVQTQCDSVTNEQPDRHHDVNHAGFEFFKSLQFSAKTSRGGAALREALWDAAEWLKESHGTPLIGVGRSRVLNRLETWRSDDAQRPSSEREHKLVSQPDFQRLCSEAGSVASPEHFLSFLHHAGVIFYQKGLFADQIILDQDWALSAIYAAFDREHCYPVLKSLRGRFTAELIARLAWGAFSSEEQQLFLTMMQSCGIAFINSYESDWRKREYIAPDLLPERSELEQVIASRWPESDAVHSTRLRFKLLHKGLIRHILHVVGGHARINAEYWRTGVLFYEQTRQSHALVEAVPDEDGWGGHVEISCRGGQALALRQALIGIVRECAESVGLRDESVGSPDAEAPPAAGDTSSPLDIAPPPRDEERWYVSYAWGDDTPEGRGRAEKVEDLCRRAAERGISVIRDTEALRSNDSIRRFMDQLTDGDRLIVILSDKYIKSPYCMFELYETWRKQKADADLFARVIRAFRLPDAGIGNAVGRAKAAKYWSDRVNEEQEYLRYMGARDTADWQLARHYALDVADILYMINDRVSPRDWDDFIEWAFSTDC